MTACYGLSAIGLALHSCLDSAMSDWKHFLLAMSGYVVCMNASIVLQMNRSTLGEFIDVYCMDQTFYDILVHLSTVAGFSPKLHHSSSLWMHALWPAWGPHISGVGMLASQAEVQEGLFLFQSVVSSQVTVHVFSETLSWIGLKLTLVQAIYQSCVGPIAWIVSSELYPFLGSNPRKDWLELAQQSQKHR